MKPSPVQLLQLVFDKVLVELDPNHAPPEPYGLSAPFSFNGVILRTAVGFAELDGAPADAHLFEVSLELIVENKKSKEKKKTQQFSPYLLHLKARCLVRLLKAASKLGPPQDLAAVNGAALIWSAMREQVAATTARMQAGQILLPTVHFQDLRTDLKANGNQPAQDVLSSSEDRPAVQQLDQVE